MSDAQPNDTGEFERFRDYLCVLARVEIGQRIQGKVDASDIVQETLLEAHQGRDQFRGDTEPKKAAWLRRILARNIADEARKWGRGKRSIKMERSLQASIEDSSHRLEQWLAAEQSSPSQKLMRNEQAVQLANVLNSLPEDQRIVIELHHLKGLKTTEVAQQLNKTEASVAGLLRRGLKKMRELLQEHSHGT